MTGIIQMNCEYSEHTLMEMQKVLHRRASRLCAVLSGVGMLLAVLGLIYTRDFLVILGSFWCAFCLRQIHHAPRKTVRQALKSYEKNYGQNVTVTLEFHPTQVVAQNHQTGSVREAAYESISRIIRTVNLIILILPENYAVMGDRRTLDESAENELWAHLTEHCTKAEITLAE